MSLTPEKIKSLFEDLGKPTMRGVRKCPKCGTINGTRGISCKNRNCDVVFRLKFDKKKCPSASAVKIITDTDMQIYSVRLRDRGPDYRGFVQLPIVQDLDGNPAESPDISIVSAAAKCFVESCLARPPSKTNDACVHILQAIHCEQNAEPLTLKNSVLNSLNTNLEEKAEILSLATGSEGPLVQRVTKNIMAVKCKVTNKHPLGYLHFSFFETSRNRTAPEYKFQCSCKDFKQSGTLKVCTDDSSVRDDHYGKDEQTRRCLHFFACLCAFACDDKLAKEFEHYLRLGNIMQQTSNVATPSTILSMTSDGTAVQESYVTYTSQDTSVTSSDALISTETIASIDSLPPCDYVTDVGPPDDTMESEDEIPHAPPGQEIDTPPAETTNVEVVIAQDDLFETANTDGNIKIEHVIINGEEMIIAKTGTPGEPSPGEPSPKKRRLDKDENTADFINKDGAGDNTGLVAQASKALLTLQEQVVSIHNKPSPVKAVIPANNKPPNKPDESCVGITFRDWLASITERINQTMHYQFDGNPDPLVFHAPQKFFECLQQRISPGNKKKRLPNFTTGFIRKDALPLGTFTKYTWHITNVFHVKQIFDTPQMSLDVTRSFIENKDGTYDLYVTPKDAKPDPYSQAGKVSIRPFELKTYLKVGMTARDQKIPTPFIIEWIPDILPQTRIGELRIKFEYGHQRNGKIDDRKNRKILFLAS